jgi:biotin transport system permease protein
VSPLHRVPPGPKLAFLAVVSVTVVVLRGPGVTLAALLLASALAALARLPWATTWRAGRSLLVLALVAGLFQWWWYGPGKAVETFVDLLSLALLALVLTHTTSTNALLDTLTRAVRPLRHVGIRPERVALAVSLAIGALPGTLAVARETRDAARARGLERSPRAYVSPFVIRVVGRAYVTGDALAARGLDD